MTVEEIAEAIEYENPIREHECEMTEAEIAEAIEYEIAIREHEYNMYLDHMENVYGRNWRELEEESEEIKEILDHKTEKGKIKYLVKWKNDKLENEWVDENNFDTVEIINEYYKKIHRKDQEETTSPIEKKRGRKKINLKSNNLALTVIILYIFIGIIGSAVQIEEDNTFEIKGDYRYCEPTQRIISLDDNCIPR